MADKKNVKNANARWDSMGIKVTSKPKKKSVKHVQIVSTKKFPVGDLNIKNDKVNASIRNFIKNL